MSQLQNESTVACAWQPQEKSTASAFNQRFSTGELSVVPHRYTLVWGAFCPWATPVAIVINLLKLDRVIDKSPVYALRWAGIDDDWFFGQHNEVDPILKTNRLSENYRKTDPDFKGRAGVPALVDIKTGKVVNNNPNGLLVELVQAWQAFTPTEVPDLFPSKQQAKILKINRQIIDNLSTVVGKIETATSQTAYVALAKRYFDQLEVFDSRLAHQPYLLGESITLSDILLFVRLVRFDVVYYYKDKLNQKPLTAFPNLWAYAKRLYHLPAFKKTTDFLAIKQHFFQVAEDNHDFEHFLPVGPDTGKWES